MSARRPPLVGRYTAEELALAGRNRGMPLEALRYDVTPQGLHYLLLHFDIPAETSVSALTVCGLVSNPYVMGMEELANQPVVSPR